MSRLAILLFIISAPTLAGIGAMIPMSIYSTADYPWEYLAIAAAIGVVVAIPFSIIVAKKLDVAFSGKRPTA